MKISKISMVIPCELPRLSLFRGALAKYKEFGFDSLEELEIIVPTRTIEDYNFYPEMTHLIKLIPYNWDGAFFCPSLALNLGVREAAFENILICSPEVVPETNVLEQFSKMERGNYLCQVFDLNQRGGRKRSLLKTRFRNPGFYFLALYKKEDIEAINGWDEDFMQGNWFDDEDFGLRFLRAGLEFEFRRDIVGDHLWHPRTNNIPTGKRINKGLMDKNTRLKITRPANGLKKEIKKMYL